MTSATPPEYADAEEPYRRAHGELPAPAAPLDPDIDVRAAGRADPWADPWDDQPAVGDPGAYPAGEPYPRPGSYSRSESAAVGRAAGPDALAGDAPRTEPSVTDPSAGTGPADRAAGVDGNTGIDGSSTADEDAPYDEAFLYDEAPQYDEAPLYGNDARFGNYVGYGDDVSLDDVSHDDVSRDDVSRDEDASWEGARIDDEPTVVIGPAGLGAASLPPEIGPRPPRRTGRYVPNPIGYEPPPPRKVDPARWMRTLAGVDERLLRQVWFERARHTALGGIILGTGLIAGFSMWMAINESVGYASVVTLIPALIWFIFIISLDRVLVSTMVGQGRRWGAFLMRLALSIMFGIIIAEPLTIRIFQTAIEQHIQDERTQQLDDLRSALLKCNTKEIATSTTPAPAGCAGYLLSFDKTPIAKEQELAAKQADEKTLAGTVNADNAEDARLRDMAAKECAGTSGPGFTGQRGYGPDCLDRHKDVAAFEASHPLKANTDRLAALRTEITALSGQISASQANFESTRDALIVKRVADEKSHQGPIGLLERMKALHDLAATTWALFLGTWAVRLFFILADCLPVVVKFSGGASQYDAIVTAQSANAVRRYEQDLEILDDEAQTHVRTYKADLDLEVQEHRADTAVRRDDAVRRVESRMLGSDR